MAYWSVRSVLASVRGLVARYSGRSNVPRRGRVHANRSPPGLDILHDDDVPYQRYQLKYQHAQQGPHGATQCHQSTTKRLVVLTSTPHALKLPEQAQAEIGATNETCEVQWEGPPQSWSRRR